MCIKINAYTSVHGEIRLNDGTSVGYLHFFYVYAYMYVSKY